MTRLLSRLAGSANTSSLKAYQGDSPFWLNNANANWSGVSPSSESIGEDFESFIYDVYKTSGVVFACMLARQMLFSEARFSFRQYRNGRPGALFSTPDLGLLERPWPGGTTGELCSRMVQDADLAGNSFWTTADDEGRIGRAATGDSKRLARLTPNWTSIILGSKSGDLYAPDTRPIAYRYQPPNGEEHLFLPSEVAHFSPLPDPAARFRGMSWLTPIVNEIAADKAASSHKLKFFKQGATLSTIVRLDKDIAPEAFDHFVTKFKEKHEGADTAYRTLFVGGGADVTVNGATMQQLDFKSTQGAGETRIAAAAGMHPVIVGLSEGLAGSSLNAGNFSAAIRLTADKTIRPLWRMAAASLSTLVPSPGVDSDLFYDDRDVAFLRDDTTDVAAIQASQAATARQLTDAGYTPTSVIEYIETGNLRVLEHSGLYSVQLQAPGQLGTLAPVAPPEGS